MAIRTKITIAALCNPDIIDEVMKEAAMTAALMDAVIGVQFEERKKKVRTHHQDNLYIA